jgi:hypothetical protein
MKVSFLHTQTEPTLYRDATSAATRRSTPACYLWRLGESLMRALKCEAGIPAS